MSNSKKASLVFRVIAIGFTALGVVAIVDGIASFGSHRLQLTAALLCALVGGGLVAGALWLKRIMDEGRAMPDGKPPMRLFAVAVVLITTGLVAIADGLCVAIDGWGVSVFVVMALGVWVGGGLFSRHPDRWWAALIFSATQMVAATIAAIYTGLGLWQYRLLGVIADEGWSSVARVAPLAIFAVLSLWQLRVLLSEDVRGAFLDKTTKIKTSTLLVSVAAGSFLIAICLLLVVVTIQLDRIRGLSADQHSALQRIIRKQENSVIEGIIPFHSGKVRKRVVHRIILMDGTVVTLSPTSPQKDADYLTCQFHEVGVSVHVHATKFFPYGQSYLNEKRVDLYPYSSIKSVEFRPPN